MLVRVLETSFHVTECRTRLPFRFGINTMTAAPLLVACVLLEDDQGHRATGYSSDLLVPKWFEKVGGQSIEADWRRLIGSVHAAGEAASVTGRLATVFGHWRGLHGALVEAAACDGASDLLVRGLGVSLVERAMLDGACRLFGLPFLDAWDCGLFGFEPEAVDPALAGWSVHALAPARGRLPVRHTVGLVDALTPGEVTERVNDGLPECLAEDIAHYGMTRFKVKVGGEPGADVDRLSRIASVLESTVPDGLDACMVTLDGNEQFESVEAFGATLRLAGEAEHASRLLERVRLIEQPLARDRTFDGASNAGIERLPWPCIIDEADGDAEALPRALAMGYRGVSVKNCKGVFRALVSAGRCHLASEGEVACFQSGEDLTNLPVIALQQDLLTAALLGVEDVERNGHHYFLGLGHLPEAERLAAGAAHPDLYVETARGHELRISAGEIGFDSALGCVGYGFDVPMTLDARVDSRAWRPEALAGS